MNIRILDSWLREFLKTKAKPHDIAHALSLSSASVEDIVPYEKDFIYDIEITTNRIDMMSVIGIAREACAVLSQFGHQADLSVPAFYPVQTVASQSPFIQIENDPRLVKRITAIVLDVQRKSSPPEIRKRLESGGIRSLNNLVDVTNYVMREIGHPAHVFDYDRLPTKKLVIRESKKGEKITTLDGKEFTLNGEDIVADNGKGKIVDLLGIMGVSNSAVTPETKRILYFIDNNDPGRIRKTSLGLGIRTEAAIMNEKGVDPELSMKALVRGIQLYQDIAGAKIVSDIIDVYPKKPAPKIIYVSQEKIDSVMGITLPVNKSEFILEALGFSVSVSDGEMNIIVPSWRRNDIEREEDIIEEVSRIYGYYKIPGILPPAGAPQPYIPSRSVFFWEDRAKKALKYWGFTETYTYSMVSERYLESPADEAIALQNPLTEDHVYMRKTIVPSLLEIAKDNAKRQELKLFEIANVYHKRGNDLPEEILTLAGIYKKPEPSFYEVKGILEALFSDFGIKKTEFRSRKQGGLGADIYINDTLIGDIEVLDENVADFELNFALLSSFATLAKEYKPVPKFPPIIEDVSIVIGSAIAYTSIVRLIRKQSGLISDVRLLDVYQNKKTFRITYQSTEKNLTNEDITSVRQDIYKSLEKQFGAKIT